MARLTVGRSIRTLRRRRGWRQEDLATAANLSQQTISRVERDLLDGLTVGSLRGCAKALGGFLALDIRWQGSGVDALIDARHAAIQDWAARMLADAGWDTRVELSFNHFGDRGRYDVIAFHPPTRLLAAVEVKTTIEDAQDTLGRLDVKVRVAARAVADLGWRPAVVVPVLVIAEGRIPHRRVAEHRGLFQRLALRGRPALAWLHRPTSPSPTGILLFVRSPDTHAVGAKGRRGPVARQVLAPGVPGPELAVER